MLEATSFEKVTVMFTDIVGFTDISSALSAMDVCRWEVEAGMSAHLSC